MDKSHAKIVMSVVRFGTKSNLPGVRALVVRILRRVYDIDRSRLEEVVTQAVELLCTCTSSTRELQRRCRGTLSFFLSKEPARSKLAITTSINLRLNSKKDDVTGIQSLLTDWSVKCSQPNLNFVDASEWRAILARIEVPNEVPQDTSRNYASWEDDCILEGSGARTAADSLTRKIMTYNSNSFRKRWREGSIQRLLQRHNPDVFHVTETRTDIRHLDDVSDVKATLFAMGYRYCYWTWCVDETVGGYGYSGSAMFSKFKPKSVKFGFTGSVASREGRSITAFFTSYTIKGCYSPCSSLSAEPSSRRVDFDESLRIEVSKLSKEGSFILVGDLNVAPTTEDGNVVIREMISTPSCKPHEREAHDNLKKSSGLVDVYRHFHKHPKKSDFTWHRSPRYLLQGIGMRLDHSLASKSFLDDSKDVVKIVGCDRVDSTYGSDHHPVITELLLPSPCPEELPTVKSWESETENPSSCKDECSCKKTDYGSSTQAVFDQVMSIAGGRDEFILPDPGDSCTSMGTSSCIPDVSREDFDSLELTDYEGDPIDEPDEDEQCMCSCEMGTGSESQSLVNSMPETELGFGSLPSGLPRVTGMVLVDSGAKPNIISVDHVRAAHARKVRVPRANRPTFTLADGTRSKPMGLVKVRLHLNEQTSFVTTAWVIPEGPYPFILGSDTMKKHKALIDYDTMRFRMRVDEKDVFTPFHCNYGSRDEAPVPLFATESVVIPPKHHVLVPVNSSNTSYDRFQGNWGLVSNMMEGDFNVSWGSVVNSVMVAKMYMPLLKHQNWVQVANITDLPMEVPRGKAIACFHRQDKNSVSMVSCDLDTDDRSLVPESPTMESPGQGINGEGASYKDFPHVQDITIGDDRRPLEDDELSRLKQLVLQYHFLWDKDLKKTPAVHGTVCDIELTGTPKIGRKGYSVNPEARRQVAEEVRKQKELGVIQDSCSPYSSTVLLVPKPTGGVRVVVDFRALNKIVKRDAYPLPRVEDSLAALQGKTYFSSIDIVTAFWQVPLSERSRQLTAFSTPDGLFEYVRMPMGLATASGVFSRFIDEVMNGLKWHCVLTYIDDCLVYSGSFDQHLKDLTKVFDRLSRHGLTLGPKKCHLCVSSVHFLGHVVNEQGILQDPAKVEAVRSMKMPETKSQLRSTLGLFGYYRRFIKNYSVISHPLVTACSGKAKLPRGKDGKVVWETLQRESFSNLKTALTSEPVLAHPDWTIPFILDTDACGHGLGAVLSQKVDGVEHVISYASRSLTKSEQSYNTWELEALAVYWSTQVFGWYLWCKRFTIRTDSSIVKWVFANAEKGRMLKWALAIQELDYEIEHRPGPKHCNADGVSRCPMVSECPYGVEPQEPIYGIRPPLPVGAVGQVEPKRRKKIQLVMPKVSKTSLPPFFPPLDVEAWDKDKLKKLQMADTKCQEYVESCLQGDGSIDPVNPFEVDDGGILYRRKHGNRNRRVVVPDSLKAFVLRRHHGLPLSGHCGRRKVYNKMVERYWWKGMSRDVKRWVRACLVCAKRKTTRPLKAGPPRSVCVTKRPFDIVAIDLVGPCSQTLDGNKYILTMLDVFTRWVIAVPIPSKESRIIANGLYRHLLTKHGCPSKIYSDRGSEFVNKGLSTMCRQWGVRQIKTTGWQPQANPVERVHRWLNSGMSSLSSKFGSEWDNYVDAVVFAYNVSKNDSTGFSPYSLIYGRDPSLPDDIMYGMAQDQFDDEKSCSIHTTKWLSEAYKLVVKNQQKMADRNRLCREKYHTNVTYNPGELVLYWQPGKPSKRSENLDEDSSVLTTTPKKWTSAWTGPHKIIKQFNGNTYDFASSDTGEVVRSNVNRLARFFPWSDELPSTSPELDTVRRFNVGGTVSTGSFFVLTLEDSNVPFGVGRLQGVRTNGSLRFQWYSNARDNVRGTFLPGWMREDGTVYYSRERDHRTHKPCTDVHSNTESTMEHVVLHGFDLTDGHRLPVPVLRGVALSGRVDWDMHG